MKIFSLKSKIEKNGFRLMKVRFYQAYKVLSKSLKNFLIYKNKKEVVEDGTFKN